MINKYRKPSFYDVFKHVLKDSGFEKIPVKSIKDKGDVTAYQTALPYSKAIQKVYFDLNNEVIKFKSLYNGKEQTDMSVKPKWEDNGKVTFTTIV